MLLDMTLVADESVDFEIIYDLRQKGITVVSISLKTIIRLPNIMIN